MKNKVINTKLKKIASISLVMMMSLTLLACNVIIGQEIDDQTPYTENTSFVGGNGDVIDITETIGYSTKSENNRIYIPRHEETSYVVVNNNEPFFEDDEMVEESFEYYSELDSFGRCGMTVASVGKDIMPTEERGDIGDVKPSGWVQEKYDNVSGKYLYNRSHLIGHQLTGEDANEGNLVTGTRHMNVEMITFENMIADYVKETGNNVYYRVTPIFEGNNLLATGILMEAKSVEDGGRGICFNVFCYNIQPGIEIDYSTGESRLMPTEESEDYLL